MTDRSTSPIKNFFSSNIADRAPLRDRAAVEAIQLKLVTCLEHLVSKRSTSRGRVRGLSQAFDILTAVRRLEGIDEYDVAKEGWIENLKKMKMKFLETEIDFLVNYL